MSTLATYATARAAPVTIGWFREAQVGGVPDDVPQQEHEHPRGREVGGPSVGTQDV